MNTDRFALRHIGPRKADLAPMLEKIGVESIEQLVYETVPANIRLQQDLQLDPAMSEYEFLSHINKLGAQNKQFRTYIGLGYNQPITPAVIQRNILENPGWYTAYTPYQAEIAQGRLEALLNYQTMVTDLTGMELSNASLLDESTAAAEAMTLLFSVRERAQKKENIVKFFVDQDTLPQTKELLKTRAIPLGIELVEGNPQEMDTTAGYYGILLQYPGASGNVVDYTAFAKKCQESNIRIAVAADILSLVLLEAPGHWGADVVVGTTQRFGIPLGYGGPHAAFFATREEFKRQIPGRIIGVTKDTDGKRALRMALQTREQHIKRDKATSNICTAQVLLAVMAGMYAVYHGPRGLKFIANKLHSQTATLADAVEKLGIYQTNENYFDTLSFKVDAEAVKKEALQLEINFYYPDADTVQVSLNETTSLVDLNDVVSAFAKAVNKDFSPITKILEKTNLGNGRQTDFMTYDVFNSYHSETELMRYIKKLERKDLALNHSMIALGSCTMKLNAAAEMLPLSNPQWGNIHPFVPLDQAAGYQQMLKKLELQLNETTGFAGTSLQPNSGAQGEFAGLMAIRAYHHSRGDHHRDICLIPSSAHGTNPASAVMAGMKVVVTKALENGNIDVDDLREKALKYKDNLSALMVTYPSTHGVYESAIVEITTLIHENGGQVYMDGANMNAQVGLTNPGNMNAQVGLTNPGNIGADVCHLNLHKTFAIPHGGGGPGVGPICVAPQLVPFLPSNPIIPTGGDQAITPISAAPFGSALACLISYGYICMLGADGLKRSTEYAIINANYIKERLKGSFECLYTGEKGRAAHEMIIDCRPFKENGIEVVDIAKRLMDYGFHAPTVSFPVNGTMMIEPTESESKEEMDRFCDAMISIREEIKSCHVDEPNNLLKNSPHTLQMITTDDWDLPYTRKQAAYPLDYVSDNKFWPTVRRADDAYGDRNLMCTCAPMEEYMD